MKYLKKYIAPALWILKITKRSKRDFGYLIALSLISSGIEILCFTILRQFLSISTFEISSDSATISLRNTSLQLAFLYSIRLIVLLLINYGIFRYASEVLNDLRNHLIELSLTKSPHSPNNLGSTVIINTIQNASINSVNVFIIALAKSLTEVLVAMVIILYLLYSDFAFTFFTIIALSITGALLYGPVKKLSLKYGNRSLRANEKTLEILTDTQSSLSTIKTFGSLWSFKEYFMMYSRTYSSVGVYEKLLRSLPRPLFESILISGIAFSVTIITYFKSHNLSIIAGLGLMAAAGLRLIPTINIISSFLQSFNFNYSSFERVTQLSAACAERNNNQIDNKQTIALDLTYSFSIQFDDFVLKSGKKLFPDHPLVLKRGQLNTIIGPSGCGKSSILEAIVGLSSNSSQPKVKIDDVQISLLEVESFRKNIAYCPQKVELIHGNIIDNIILDPLVSVQLSDSQDAAKFDFDRLYKCMDDVELLSQLGDDGVYTHLSPLNPPLSGGQLQRLALARAIFHRKNIIVLDELTSGLDPSTENKIIDLLTKLSKNYFIVMATHSKEVIRNSRVCYSFNY
tara:strand:+ start:6816 stop:8528 length:1713 start_codon:yes stop_codon:yes gene_type:complete